MSAGDVSGYMIRCKFVWEYCATEAQYQYVRQELSARSQVPVLTRDFFCINTCEG